MASYSCGMRHAFCSIICIKNQIPLIVCGKLPWVTLGIMLNFDATQHIASKRRMHQGPYEITLNSTFFCAVTHKKFTKHVKLNHGWVLRWICKNFQPTPVCDSRQTTKNRTTQVQFKGQIFSSCLSIMVGHFFWNLCCKTTMISSFEAGPRGKTLAPCSHWFCD